MIQRIVLYLLRDCCGVRSDSTDMLKKQGQYRWQILIIDNQPYLIMKKNMTMVLTCLVMIGCMLSCTKSGQKTVQGTSEEKKTADVAQVLEGMDVPPVTAVVVKGLPLFAPFNEGDLFDGGKALRETPEKYNKFIVNGQCFDVSYKEEKNKQLKNDTSYFNQYFYQMEDGMKGQLYTFADAKAVEEYMQNNGEVTPEGDVIVQEYMEGILVPGGFGSRGVEGKISAAEYCLKNNKPYLGICLGLQTAVIAAARIGGLEGANSEELDAPEGKNVVYIMEGQKGKESTGGTMRLGNYPAKLVKGTKIAELYGDLKVVERHRHRYEVNQKFMKEINAGGLIIAGTSPDGKLVEFVEAPDCDYFVATQAHPEFRSRPYRAHPLFDGLIQAASK